MITDSGTDESSYPPPDEALAPDSPLRFFEGELHRVPISFGYRLSLVVVSFAMILLPIIYFAVIGLFGYCIYWYAVHCSSILDWHTYGARGAIFKLMVYFGPIFIGVVLIFFFVKPLFAPKHEPDEPFSLNHADAPQLFALLGWICRSLDAPIPSRIDVDLSVNAAAGFRGGLRSLFGNDVVLLIGLPLVAGLNLSQFAGVIAHEYGHFSQGAAMRAGYIIRRINGWFYRVVYERDQWDYSLIVASEHENQHVATLLVLYLARLGVWIGRRILWVLMMAGHALSSFLSRQMEFDADLYEINLAGSESFIASTHRMAQLNIGAVAAEKQLIGKWKQEKKLFDQIPEFIVSRANEISAEIQSSVHSKRAKHKSLFDSHPSDKERIQRAVAANAPGIFHPQVPATSLFADFAGLSRRVTVAHYQKLIGPAFREDVLISTEQVVRTDVYDATADWQNIQRYFLNAATPLRPVIIAENKTMSVRHVEDLAAAIRANREAMARSAPAAQVACARFHEADTRFLQACQAAQLLQAGFPFDPAHFNLTHDNLERAQAEASQALRMVGADIFPLEEAARNRLSDTVQLLRLCRATTLVPNVQRLEDEAKALVWVLSRLGPSFETWLELRKDCAALEIFLYYRRHSSADNATATLENLCASIQERINRLQSQTSQIRYPFSHAGGEIFVSYYLRNTEYHADPTELLLREAKSHIEKLSVLHQRLLGGLVLIFEEVERHAVP